MKSLILLLALTQTAQASWMLSSKTATCESIDGTVEEFAKFISHGKGCEGKRVIPFSLIMLHCPDRSFFIAETEEGCKAALNSDFGDRFKNKYGKNK